MIILSSIIQVVPVAGKAEGLKIVAVSTVFSCDCELLLRKYEKSIKE